MADVFRLQPSLPPWAVKTYAIRSPLATHTNPATCAQVDCKAYANGWVTTVDEDTALGQRQAGYIRHKAGRHYTEHRTPAGLTDFHFPPGQRCFAQHRIPLDRPEHYFVRPGDWRTPVRPDEVYRHTRAEFWVEDFAEHQDKLKTAQERG